MIITRVRYTVGPDYSEQNKENIARVTSDLKSLDRRDVRYLVFIENDGITFNHFYLCVDEESEKIIGTLESFKKFRTELRASTPELQPITTKLTLVGSSFDLFDTLAVGKKVEEEAAKWSL